MGAKTIAENHIVIRVMHFDHYYSLFLEDATILSIPYRYDQKPRMGESLSVTRHQKYGYIMNIKFADREIHFC
ncbi:MAG: hypothetical protein ACOH5I_07715 [Oligoflexus sp.]